MTTAAWLSFIGRNHPPAHLLQEFDLHQVLLVLWVYQADQRLGVRLTPTSWYRSVAKNAAVGGSADSQHLVGCGLDVVGASASELRPLLPDLFVVQESDHVHVQCYAAGAITSRVRALRR